ncbi:MAG: electron transfer flavoprotein subunit alpha/FixB family protein [Deltaproteobacteria bacterium]|nr:electron transfer flavoprotein subunit alpha/FixB family protein [Deltaproteobacteria bacterium]
MAQIFTYITYKDQIADDAALELAAAAKQIDADAPVTAIVTGSGPDLDAVCNAMAQSYQEVWKFDNEALAYPNGEVIRKLLVNTLPSDAIFLMAHDTFGMDLAPGLSIKLADTFASDVVGVDGRDGSVLNIVRQEYGGMVSAHVSCDISGGAVITVRPGGFAADESKTAAGQVVDKSGDVGDLSVKRRFLEIVAAEVGDVDITKSEVLVSVGRGIEDEDNIEIVQELAEVMGADVSCSRPIVDSKWMEKSRQVGTSGQTVKPKVYLACGISGSFQHLGGLKGNPFVVAINKNTNAPIFQVADVGIEADILDFLPELTEKIEGM